MSAAGVLKSVDIEQQWDCDSPEKNEAQFTEAFRQLESAQSPNSSLMIEVLTQVARAQGLLGKIQDAERTLAKAEALLERNMGEHHVCARIRYLLEKGRVFCLLKTPARALPLFSEAWTLANRASEDFHAIDAAQMIASVESPKMKRDCILKAVNLAEKSVDRRSKLKVAPLYLTLGWQSYELRLYDKAQEQFMKALRFLELDLKESAEDIAVIKRIVTAKYAIGKALRALGKIEEALKIQEDLFAELQRSGSKNGDVCEEIAECLTSLKRADQAALYFEIAYRELSKDEWVVDNMSDRIKRLKALGKVK